MRKTVLFGLSVLIMSPDFATAIPFPAELETAIDDFQKDCNKRKSDLKAVLTGKFHPSVKKDVDAILNQLNEHTSGITSLYYNFKMGYVSAETDEERGNTKTHLAEIQDFRLQCKNMVDELAIRAQELKTRTNETKSRSSTH